MIWKYIIRDLNGAIQYLPYGVMAGAVMGLILNAMNARRERKGKEAFPMAGLMVFSLYLMIILTRCKTGILRDRYRMKKE